MSDEKPLRRKPPKKRTWSRADIKAALLIYLRETPLEDREDERQKLMEYLRTVKPWS